MLWPLREDKCGVLCCEFAENFLFKYNLKEFASFYIVSAVFDSVIHISIKVTGIWLSKEYTIVCIPSWCLWKVVGSMVISLTNMTKMVSMWLDST